MKSLGELLLKLFMEFLPSSFVLIVLCPSFLLFHLLLADSPPPGDCSPPRSTVPVDINWDIHVTEVQEVNCDSLLYKHLCVYHCIGKL